MTTNAEKALSTGLRSELTAHSARFSPLYGGYLSDHGPMAALALIGLGAAADVALTWLKRYRARLEPLAAAPIGYQRARTRHDAAIAERGIDEVLSERLPPLISGWVRDAFHPLIRIAYGYEFGIEAEVAAGLAYLEWCEPDPRLETLAVALGDKPPVTNPAAALIAVQAAASGVRPGRTFTEALADVIADPAFAREASAVAEPLRSLSRTALDVFASSDDFFALHLITGADAFQTLYPFAGEHREALFNLGLLAGYAAAGAPPFEPFQSAGDPPDADTPALAAWPAQLDRVDEHVIKLTHSASHHAHRWTDPGYRQVARDYATRRATGGRPVNAGPD